MRLTFLSLIAVPFMLGGCMTTASEISGVEPEPDMAMMKDVVRELSSDKFEGRAPGGPGEPLTIDLMTRKFAEAGLKPGNNGSWLQQVPLVEIDAKNMSQMEVTSKASGKGRLLSPSQDFVAVTYREQPKIDLKNSEVVFVGYGINAPERGWNDYEGVDVKGKTVLILVNDPDFESDGLEGTFGGKAMTYYGRWTYKYEEAARQGAAAALIIHDTAPASYGWNVVESSWTGPQYYAETKNGNMDQTLVNGWVTMDAAKTMVNDVAFNDLGKLMEAAKKPGFKAVPLDARIALSFENKFVKTKSNNIIGIMPGTKRPDEYVLYTAHWDHLGHCTAAPDGDDICNGAVDNGTGTAALAVLADMYKQQGAPDRSVIFLAVTAEESGLLGSAYYADNPVYPLGQTVGGVNMDAFLVTPPARDVIVVGKGKSELDAYLEAAAKKDGRYLTPNPKPEAGYYYRSDHFSLAKKGVPMVYFDAGEDLYEGGEVAGKMAAAEYTELRYHGPKDEYDPNWDWSGVEQDLRLYYRVGRALADTTDWPNWVDGDEFRAIRDASRAGQE